MPEDTLFDADRWSELSLAEHRAILIDALLAELTPEHPSVSVSIEVGPTDRPYDLTAAVQTDAGVLRAPLWSHARATIFTDRSVHPENRQRYAPGLAVREAAIRLRPRLAVPFRLESRGLTVSHSPMEGVERTWSAERSLFRGRTAVVREDRIAATGEVDLRDLLARHYSGPSIRVVGEDGTAFLLPGTSDGVEGPLISLCPHCQRWEEGEVQPCPHCGAQTDLSVWCRPPRR